MDKTSWVYGTPFCKDPETNISSSEPGETFTDLLELDKKVLMEKEWKAEIWKCNEGLLGGKKRTWSDQGEKYWYFMSKKFVTFLYNNDDGGGKMAFLTLQGKLSPL